MPDQAGRGACAPLSADRIHRAALRLADRDGLAALSMRRLGAELGVEAMSLYKHVAGRDEILDALVELVIAEIELPDPSLGWREAMLRRARSAREALARHPWALGLLESRTAAGPAALRYYDAVVGTLRGGGFTVPQAAHAFWLLDSFVYGHALQESALPFDRALDTAESTREMLEALDLGGFPHLAELAREHILRPGYRYADEFEAGLGLILDGLERMRGPGPAPGPR